MIYLDVASAVSAIFSAVAVLLLACMAWQARNQPAELQQKQWAQERLTLKQDVLRRIVGHGHRLPRGLLDSDEPFIALNEAEVVFSDCPEVLEALSRLRRSEPCEPPAPLLYAVVVAMARGINITDEIDMDFVGYPFVPGNFQSRSTPDSANHTPAAPRSSF